MILLRDDKRICMQGAINTYHGEEGPDIWDLYDKASINWWDVGNQEGYHGIIDHPKHGKIQMIGFQDLISVCHYFLC